MQMEHFTLSNSASKSTGNILHATNIVCKYYVHMCHDHHEHSTPHGELSMLMIDKN